MRKATINAIVDIIMVIAFIPTLLSGVVLFWFLPEGGRFSGQALFVGIIRNAWKDIHDYAGFALAALIILHLLLHWKFLKAVPSCFRKKACGFGHECFLSF